MLFLIVPWFPVRMTGRDKALRAVEERLHAKRWNAADLAREAGLDTGTVGDFLAGTRWPQRKTRGQIEEALGMDPGTLDAIARGQEPPQVTEVATDVPGLQILAGAYGEVDEDAREAILQVALALRAAKRQRGNGAG